jgi:hypothetical protein
VIVASGGSSGTGVPGALRCRLSGQSGGRFSDRSPDQLVHHSLGLNLFFLRPRRSERGGDWLEDHLVEAYTRLKLTRFGLFQTVTEVSNMERPGPEASIGKLRWSQWTRNAGSLPRKVSAPRPLAWEVPDAFHHIVRRMPACSLEPTVSTPDR